MLSQDYIFQDRAVAFVDVLGFREKLQEFEQDARTKSTSEGSEYLISEKVNEFINTFKNVTSLLDSGNFRYYLFSDNICITVDYVENPDLLISLLFTISELFYSFAQKGYFLRGGIDVGKFVDEQEIALGVPLAKAYLMESKDAVYPRILISPGYTELLKNYQADNRLSDSHALNKQQLIHESCEFSFLNVFYNVIRKDDKVAFFTSFRQKIVEQLGANAKNEKIFIKYQWLAEQYNTFLDLYVEDLIYREDQFEPSPELVGHLKTLKI
jgi:hypothetical protein